MTAVVMAQTPTVSASKVTLMYCTTTTGTLNQEAVPFEWGGETFTEQGSYVRVLENARGCDSILTIRIHAPEGAGIAKFNIGGTYAHVATGNLIWTSTGTHNTADGQNTTGTFSILTPSYSSCPSGWREVFRYAYSGYNSKSPSSNDTHYDSQTVRSNITNTYYDWGKYNSIYVEGGNCEVGRWRAMTATELETLLGNSRGAARVGGTNGLVIVPSNWQNPTGLTFVKWTDDYSQNIFNEAEWAQMEQRGAIFFKNGQYCTTTMQSGYDADKYVIVNGYSISTTYVTNNQAPRFVRLVYVPAQ